MITPALIIRPAAASDAQKAVELLYASAPELLAAVFGDGDQNQAKDYLSFAWQFEGGQYGCLNHHVATLEEQVVGVVSAWHRDLGKSFAAATIASLHAHYGLDEALAVVRRSHLHTADLQPPQPHQIALGHLSVAPHVRRNGVALRLVKAVEALGRELGKEELVLDVETNNQDGLALFTALGLRERTKTSQFIQLAKSLG